MALMFEDSLGDGVPGLRGFRWHTAAGELADAVVDEAFAFMSLRLRTIACEPGRRLRWRIAVRYLPGMTPVAPLVIPLFRALFEKTLDALEQRCAELVAT